MDSVIEIINVLISIILFEYMKIKFLNVKLNFNCFGFENNLFIDLKFEDDWFMCKICMDVWVGIVFIFCGYIVLCLICVMFLWKCLICWCVI